MLGYGIPTITTHLSGHEAQQQSQTVAESTTTTATHTHAHAHAHAHTHTPAQVIREVDALAHLPSDDGEEQCSRECPAVGGTTLTNRGEG